MIPLIAPHGSSLLYDLTPSFDLEQLLVLKVRVPSRCEWDLSACVYIAQGFILVPFYFFIWHNEALNFLRLLFLHKHVRPSSRMLHISTFLLLFQGPWQIHRCDFCLNLPVKLWDIYGFCRQLLLTTINVSTLILANSSMIAIAPASRLSQRSAIILKRSLNNLTGGRRICTPLSQGMLIRSVKLAWIGHASRWNIGISMDYLFTVF